MDFYTPYNPPKVGGVDFSKSPSLVHSEFQKDCDVNEMVRRALCGDMSVMRHPDYSDISTLPEDSHELANLIANANSAWHDMPDSVRSTFGSVEALIDYWSKADSQKKTSDTEVVESPTTENKSSENKSSENKSSETQSTT